ncbi:hypothetical protein [Actinomadura kijaniata]|uniref:hypothetical protein n=1 Tax=Actinomadura kijaniata TaxID=46161 RepID=UPI0031D50ED4
MTTSDDQRCVGHAFTLVRRLRFFFSGISFSATVVTGAGFFESDWRNDHHI